MISQTVEYALRAVVSLAYHQGESRTSAQIAEETRVPGMYLAKILQGLAREGLVNSQRGPGGGFLLSRPSEQITLWDVIEAVDPIPRIHHCPLQLRAHRHQLCPLHKEIDDTAAIVEDRFRSSYISDMLVGNDQVKPLCETPEQT